MPDDPDPDADSETDPTARNRLDEEESPYLRQHADNPVNWQPWDEAAREAAREQDKPIFLSIGYAACHWCHVMEEESFQDEEVAALLNEHFVPVKVDREERPDVDSVYMSICQQVTGRGGWPLNAWLTPEGDPFYVGTYFPKESQRNAPGFRQLLSDIAESWADPEQREDMEQRAAKWTRAIENDLEDVPDQPGELPGEGVLDDAASATLRGADREYGGWGRGQKFPHSGRVRVLTRAFEETGRDAYREVVTETLDAMAGGGMYDHLGGGFHRYTTDREWVVPHFEKMLYDNAELPRAYLTGYRLTGRERYRDAALETLSFVERELTHPGGGFYSTLDAQSAPPDDPEGEPEEGAFYVWTPGEVRDAVTDGPDPVSSGGGSTAEGDGSTADSGGSAPAGEESTPAEPVDPELAADLLCDRYGVTASGNFEGRTVLTVSESIETLAGEYDLSPGTVEAALDAAERAVFAAREERPRPARDEKVLAGWNGLMVSAFADAAPLDPSLAETATDALGFVRENLWDPDANRLSRRYRDGDVAVDGYLEDYAFLARGAFDAYGATGEVEHLAFALSLARAIEAEFWDEDDRTLYFTPRSGESLVARPQELADQSTPSSAGVAAELLATLDHFVDHDRFGDVARGVVETHADRISSDPVQHPSLVLAADALSNGPSELTLALDLDDGTTAVEAVPDAWRETLSGTYLPRRVLAPRPADEAALDEWLDALSLDEASPVWAGREARDDGPTVYACRERACSPPTHDLGEALAWF